ncbi:MAG TPA: DNA ligase D, partial [Thermoanaerobaculia bacterium]|nr:DNA ligase D [Thermoanaerobaculia bacterium]
RLRAKGGDDGDNWLLIKEKDEHARPGTGEAILEERPESVASGQSIEEIAADPQRVWQSKEREEKVDSFKQKLRRIAAAAGKKTAPRASKRRSKVAAGLSPAKISGAKKAPLPRAPVKPELATLALEAPRGDDWLHEIKHDGYRVLAVVHDGKAKLFTRTGKDWSDHFPPVADAAAELPVGDALLDGEVVVLEPDGRSSFQALQNALSENRGEDLVYFAFDLLHLDGFDLRGAPLVERKEALRQLLAASPSASEGSPIRLSEHVQGQGEEFHRHACGMGLEGIVSKRAASLYRGERGKDWLKVKCLQRQEFVIVGYTDPEGSRSGFGALLLAVYEGERLVFAGRVGTGFNQESLTDIKRRLDKLARPRPAVATPPRGALARGCHWVEPKLVAEVAFSEWTHDGVLRHPSFQGLREDKPPKEVVRERPASPPAAKETAQKESPKRGRGKEEMEVAGVRITHPDKVLYPGEGITKGEVALFYEAIADRILPQLANRPLTLVRCPDGISKQCFYQKHVTDQFPSSVLRVDVGEEQPYAAVDSLQGLLALVQMRVLEIHIWGAHRDRIEQPDYIVFDLDPDLGLAWERVALGALRVRERLADLGLTTFLKTTGGKGLHVVAPLSRRLDWEEVKSFTKAVAESIVAAEPKLYTSMMPKARRQEKIFIDYLRNGRGATSISAYSTRSRPGAAVSTPLAWEELENPDLRGDTYTVQNLRERLEALSSDPWKQFFKTKQSITAAMRKSLGC